MESQKDPQEIDLIRILSIIWRRIACVFAVVYKSVVWSVRYAYKKKLYMLAALVCSIAFTAFWGRPVNRKYQMDSELRINVLDAYYFKDVIESIDHMCRNKDSISMSKNLKITPKVAQILESAKAYYVVDKLMDGTPDEVCYGEYVADTTKRIMSDRLVIRLVLKDTTFIDTMANVLLRYLEENPYVKKVNEQRIAQIDNKIANINKEVVMLDSLRKYEYFVKHAKDLQLEGPLIVSEKSKQLYYNDILSLAKMRDECVFEREVYAQSVNYLHDFVLVKEENKYLKTFICSFALFVVLAFILAVFNGKKSNIKTFLEK